MYRTLNICQTKFYGISILSIIIALLLCGCKDVTPPVRSSIKAPSKIVTAGQNQIILQASPQKYQSIANQARQYLARNLPPQIIENATLTIKLAITPTAIRNQSSPGRFVEMTFRLKNGSGNQAINTASLSRICPAADQQKLQNTVNSIIDNWIAKNTLPVKPLSERLLTGSSPYSAQAYRQASQGNYAKSLKLYIKAIDENPNSSDDLYNAGLICQHLGQPKRARRFFQRAKLISEQPQQDTIIHREAAHEK